MSNEEAASASGMPLPQVRGRLVYLRAAERSDVPTFTRWFNDDRVTRFLAMDTPFSSVTEEGWFDRLQGIQGKSLYHFVICLRDSGEPIGTIGLHDVDMKHGTAEVGIAIGDPRRWSQGLGADAMRAVLDFAFGNLRLDRIALQVYDYNLRARRSYEKVGFVHEGVQREALYRNGKRVDIHLMSVLRREWLSQPGPHSWQLDPSNDEPSSLRNTPSVD
jgi:RimJ/RimL family protein N-acetyltransferase